MKTIEVSLSDAEFDAVWAVADRQQRPLSDVAHDALVSLLDDGSSPAFDLPAFAEPKQIAPLPFREELYDEMFDRGRAER